jgi:hypothetical protein
MSSARMTFLLFLTLLVPAAFCSAQTPEGKGPKAAQVPAAVAAPSADEKVPKQMVILFQQQAAFDDHLPNERNPAGLAMEFAKIGELNVERGRFAIYRAYVRGAAENQKYVMAQWKIGSDPQVLPGDVYVNAKGLLMKEKPSPEQEDKEMVDSDIEVELDLQAARAEPIRYLLYTADGKFSVPGTVVPYPIESRDRGCKLEVRLALPNADAVLIYADGLPTKKEAPLELVSAGQSTSEKLAVDGRGHAETVDLPFVTGKDSGTLKASIATKACATSVEIPWGKGSYTLH